MTPCATTTRIAATALLAAAAVATDAGVNQWTPASGDWFDPANWTNNVPADGEVAYVMNGGTVNFTGGVTAPVHTVRFGGWMGPGHMHMTDGTFHAYSFEVGASSFGTALIDGPGALIDATFVVVAQGAGGEFDLDAGVINASMYLAAGWSDDGSFFHNAGVVNTPLAIVGNNTTASGQYRIFDGALNATVIHAGSSGVGQFIQDGGVVTADEIWIPSSAGDGQYILNGGVLNVGMIRRHATGDDEFTFNGGVLNVGSFGFSAAFPTDLTCDGGVLSPGGDDVGTSIITGVLDFNAAATCRIDLDGPDDADRIITEDLVYLTGGLDVDLGYAPAGDEAFTILQNNDVSPIIFTFDGLPEGASVPATFGGDTYNFAITYAGGDGNDIVLAACFGDATGDGLIDFDDLNAVLSNWGEPGPEGDLNGSGLVDFDDLNLVLSHWEEACI